MHVRKETPHELVRVTFGLFFIFSNAQWTNIPLISKNILVLTLALWKLKIRREELWTHNDLDFKTPKIEGHAYLIYAEIHVLNHNKYFDESNGNDTCISRRGGSNEKEKFYW